MDSKTSSKEEDETAGSQQEEATPRTSLSSNASNFIVQTPSALNNISDVFTPSHSIDDIRDVHQLSRQALSRRLSTLSIASSFGDVGEGILNWNPREASVNGLTLVHMSLLIVQRYRMY